MEVIFKDNDLQFVSKLSEATLVKSGFISNLLNKEFSNFKKAVIYDKSPKQDDIAKIIKNGDTLHIFNASSSVLGFGEKIKLSDIEIPAFIPLTGTEINTEIFREVKDDNGKVIAFALKNIVITAFDIASPYAAEIDNTDKSVAIEKSKKFLSLFMRKIKQAIEETSDVDYSGLLKIKLKNIMEKQIKNKEKSLKEQITKNEEMLAKTEEQMTQLIRQNMLLTKMLSALENNNTYEKAEKIINTIKKMPLVKDIIIDPFSEEDIKITTRDILLTDTDGKKYNMGSYTIIFRNGKVKIVNEIAAKKDYKYHHPHISDSSICWGNLSAINKYIANYEYDTAIAIILAALQNWNPNDCYIKLSEIVEALNLKPIGDNG